MIIQGSAGIGKSAMIEAIFKSRDIEELPKDGSPINPQKQYYIKVEAALPLTQKRINHQRLRKWSCALD